MAYLPEVLQNGDTVKQLLARSRYLLFKHPTKRTPSQEQRTKLLFERYPLLKQAYGLSLWLRDIFRVCTSKEQAFKRLGIWHNEVESSNIESFRTVSRSVESHYLSILNFFISRSTNASAESFNATVKTFRATPEESGM